VFAGDVVVTGTVKDDSECTVLVDGARAAIADGRWRATIHLLADTEATIKVSARDAAGNEAEPLQHALRGEPAFTKVEWAQPEPDSKRVAIGDRMYPSVVRDPWTNQRMVLVPAGEFTMGSPASEAERGDDETAHRCVIGKAFWLGETEVTQDLWSRTMGGNPSQHRGDMNPVDSVSWDDCQRFLETLRGGTKTGYRLPSEAEWEYACRAGSDAPFAFGVAITSEQVNFDGSRPYAGSGKSQNRRQVLPAHSLSANAFGLFDMHGNVYEWCEDVYAPYPGTGTEEPARGDGKRVVRGGAWASMASGCRSAFRFSQDRWTKNERVGLRLARSLDPQ
jgi:formylglycine-generating enzyme required for sulfatase activity